PALRRGGGRLLPDHRLHAGEVPPRLTDLQGVVQLAEGLLEAQAEEGLRELLLLALQLLDTHLAGLLGLHSVTSTSPRFTNLVLMRSLCAARRRAARASASGTPSIS